MVSLDLNSRYDSLKVCRQADRLLQHFRFCPGSLIKSPIGIRTGVSGPRGELLD